MWVEYLGPGHGRVNVDRCAYLRTQDISPIGEDTYWVIQASQNIGESSSELRLVTHYTSEAEAMAAIRNLVGGA